MKIGLIYHKILRVNYELNALYLDLLEVSSCSSSQQQLFSFLKNKFLTFVTKRYLLNCKKSLQSLIVLQKSLEQSVLTSIIKNLRIFTYQTGKFVYDSLDNLTTVLVTLMNIVKLVNLQNLISLRNLIIYFYKVCFELSIYFSAFQIKKFTHFTSIYPSLFQQPSNFKTILYCTIFFSVFYFLTFSVLILLL